MLFKNKRVLDIGCHKGDLAIELASYHQVKSVTGCDIDPQLVQVAIA